MILNLLFDIDLGNELALKQMGTIILVFSDECQIKELAEAYNPRIQPTHNLNLLVFRRNFPVCLCMRSFEPLCGGRKIIFPNTVTVCDPSCYC